MATVQNALINSFPKEKAEKVSWQVLSYISKKVKAQFDLGEVLSRDAVMAGPMDLDDFPIDIAVCTNITEADINQLQNISKPIQSAGGPLLLPIFEAKCSLSAVDYSVEIIPNMVLVKKSGVPHFTIYPTVAGYDFKKQTQFQNRTPAFKTSGSKYDVYEINENGEIKFAVQYNRLPFYVLSSSTSTSTVIQDIRKCLESWTEK